jgi:hypothetical protein
MVIDPAAASGVPTAADAVVGTGSATSSGSHAYWFLDMVKPAGAVIGGQVASWLYDGSAWK